MSGVEERVVVVTGAGGGLGREYALMMANAGAKVIVNDLGGDRHGDGGGSMAADQVVDEIRAAGGEAAPNYDSVATAEGGASIVNTALEAFGRIDGVVANAGILRDKSFHKMTDDDWNAVLQVHLYGAYYTIHAAWPHFRENNFGRIVVATSTSGIYGNFGQGNYGAAKLGMVGLINTLAIEGAKYNIKANALAPVAATRMTEDIMDQATLDRLGPALVAPIVTKLMTDEIEETGSIFLAGGGKYWRLAIAHTEPVSFDHVPTLDELDAAWPELTDLSSISTGVPDFA